MRVARRSVLLASVLLIVSWAAKADTLCIFALSHPHGDAIAKSVGSAHAGVVDTAPGTLDNHESYVLPGLAGSFGREDILAKDPILEDFWRDHRRTIDGDGSAFSKGSYMGSKVGKGDLHPSSGPMPVGVPDQLPINASEPGVLALLASGMAAGGLVLLKRPARS